jgi:hypothetical protein
MRGACASRPLLTLSGLVTHAKRKRRLRRTAARWMYIITARRIISSELLKKRKGLRIAGGYGRALSDSSQFALTLPFQ